MSAARSNRWVLSFADLCLVLLGFFVMLHAQKSDQTQLSQTMRKAFGNRQVVPGMQSEAIATGPMFEPAEAVLKPESRARFQKLGRDALISGEHIRLISAGRDQGSIRLDAWELSAARTTAIARAIGRGGLPEQRIEISIAPMRDDQDVSGQLVTLERIKPH